MNYSQKNNILFGLLFCAVCIISAQTKTGIIAFEQKDLAIVYLGMENTIRVASETPFSSVSAENGEISLTSNPNEYVLRPNSVGKCSLSVLAGNEIIAKKVYTVKRIPSPQLMLGSVKGGEKITKAELCTLNALSVSLENFLYETPFHIISNEITIISSSGNPPLSFYGSGARITSECMAAFKSVETDDKIYVDAKVKGPDGAITALAPLAIQLK
jgi:GldM C-terminal domain